MFKNKIKRDLTKKFFELFMITFLTWTCTLCPLTAGIKSSHPDPGLKEEINLHVNFYTSLWYSKGFMKAAKTFIKPSEVSQRSENIDI